jgi:predicted transcriptional regulator
MPRKKSVILADHELRLMNVLWRCGSVTVGDVVEALLPPPLAYSTDLTTLRTLEQKGYISHKMDGRAYVYTPLVAREQAARSAVGHVVNRFFGNSPGALALTLIDETPLSEEDVAELRRLLAKRSKRSAS